MTKPLSKTKILNAALIGSGAVFFFADLYLKKIAMSGYLPDFHVGQWLSLQLSKNEYIAFSLPIQGKWLELLILLIILGLSVATVWIASSRKNRFQATLAVALALIVLGALSNLIDRFRYGYVIDYIYIRNLISLNLADVLISLATAGIILYIFGKKKEA